MELLLIFSCVISVGFTQTAVNFDITSPEEVYNKTLKIGNQKVLMKISETKYQSINLCSGWCEVNKINNITISRCSVNITENEQLYILAELEKVEVTKSGNWTCTLNLIFRDEKTTQTLNMAITVEATKIEIWVIVVVAVGIFVILIIIGQTICILYFKAKAKRAQINKNLTPKNSTHEHDLPDTRYVKKNNVPGEGVRESVIYEALETVRERAPIPPPIETLPVTPKPQHILRPAASQSNLQLRPEAEHSRTTPRKTKNLEIPGKFYTVQRDTSFKRIQNRPPQPLPTADEIYEDVAVMTPGPSPKPTKSVSRFRQPKTQEKSPLLTPNKPKKTLFGQRMPVDPPQNQRYVPAPSHKPPVGIPGSSAHKPAVEIPRPSAHKPPVGVPGSNVLSPGQDQRPMTSAGHPVPGPSGRPPMRQGQQPIPNVPPGVIAAMAGVPILPSMVTSAALKPVNKTIPRAIAEEPSRMNPELSVPRMASPSDHSNSNIMSKPRPVPPFKPKPPVPVPVEPDPLPEEPEFYNESSDEEFDCYDDLSQYRIYGNAPPKKF